MFFEKTRCYRLFDAIRLEANNHQEKIRGISNRLKEMHRTSHSIGYSDSSLTLFRHQRYCTFL